MNKITSLYTLCLMSVLLLFSCQNDDLGSDNIGYLRLQMGVNESTHTKAGEVYNPEQMAVQILRADGTVVEETSNFAAEWQGKQIALPVGTYTLQASSAGFDGQTSGFNKPYYAGQTEFVIEKGKEINATVTCTLANVKVTVNFDKSFQKYFKTATVTVGKNETQGEATESNSSITPLVFEMGKEQGSGYFPAIDLQAKLELTNLQDENFSQTDAIRNVKPRDHYILNYSVGVGEGSIDIDVDEKMHTYTFHINISTTPKTSLAAPSANAWGKLAYLEGSVISATETLDTGLMKFQYRKKGDAEWTDASTTTYDETPAQGTTPTTDEGDLTPKGTFKATLTGLTPETEYECRMVYADEEYSSEATGFTTEAITPLYNGNFDIWSQSGETIYPDSSQYAGHTTSFWNTSNPGTAEGAGALFGGALNTTIGVNSPVHTVGGKAAQLKSAYKVIAFAAASLYTGNFAGLSGMTANMEFGKPFKARPIALHGYYQYTPVVINHVDRVPAGATIEAGKTMDECAIYIALASQSFTFNNGDESTFIDYEGDDRIIAYGELPSGAATTENGYTEFTIPLRYKNLTQKPTHIIVVCSASKYGDYMTGGEGSTLYVDDFELIYDGIPALWE